MRSVFYACISFLLTALPAQAQIEQYDAGIFFDPQGTKLLANVESFEQFDAYVVGFDLDGEVFGYEGRLASSLGWTLDGTSGVTQLSLTLTGPSPTNIGNFPDFIVGTQTCIADSPGPMVLVRLELAYLAGPAPADLEICLEGIPGNFPPIVSGYARCDGTYQAFGNVPSPLPGFGESCAVVNPSALATEPTSFGGVKARY